MKKVISVRFKDNGKSYYFDPADADIKAGDYVIVETARGIECGEVVQGVREIADTLEKKHGRKIIFTPGLRTDTPAFLASADVFVGASRAALEAMSCGRPSLRATRATSASWTRAAATSH